MAPVISSIVGAVAAELGDAALRAAAARDQPELDLRQAELGELEAMTMSQHSTSSMPPPSAKPLTAAITGLRLFSIAAYMRRAGRLEGVELGRASARRIP